MSDCSPSTFSVNQKFDWRLPKGYMTDLITQNLGRNQADSPTGSSSPSSLASIGRLSVSWWLSIAWLSVGSAIAWLSVAAHTSHRHSHSTHGHAHSHSALDSDREVDSACALALVIELDGLAGGVAWGLVKELHEVDLAFSNHVVCAEGVLVPDLHPHDGVAGPHEREGVAPAWVSAAFFTDSRLLSFAAVVQNQVGVLNSHLSLPSYPGSRCLSKCRRQGPSQLAYFKIMIRLNSNSIIIPASRNYCRSSQHELTGARKPQPRNFSVQ